MGKNVHSFKTEADEKIEMSRNTFYGGLSAEHLKSFIERIERLEQEKTNICQDIKEVYGEAKGTGFDIKIMKRILRERGMDQSILDEEEFLLDTYRRALGMTPLERYAAEQAEMQKTDITVAGKEFVGISLAHLLKAVKTSDQILSILKEMRKWGGFRPVTEGDEKIAAKFMELKLLKKPVAHDNLYMLTAQAEKMTAGD